MKRHASKHGASDERVARKHVVANPRCRLCSADLNDTFVDTGMSPPRESHLSAEQLDCPEASYPMHVHVCAECLLVQLPALLDGVKA
jgi:hypothetical protein